MKASNLLTIICLIRCYENEALSILSSSKAIISPLSTSPLFRNANGHELNILMSTITPGGFSQPNNHVTILSNSPLFNSMNHLKKKQRNNIMKASTSSAVPDSSSKSNRAPLSELRKQGGIFSFDTPIGALNIYGLFYGLTAIGLGMVWYATTMFWKLIHAISGQRFDKMVRIFIDL